MVVVAADVEVLQAGVDTWSPCWRMDRDSEMACMMDSLAWAAGGRGGVLREVVDGHRVGWLRDVGLLWAEGRAGGDAVLPCSAVSARYAALVSSLLAAGVPVPAGEVREGMYPVDGLPGIEASAGSEGLRRADLTLDLRFNDPAGGVAFLAAVAAVARTLPGYQAEIRCAKDGCCAVETVYLRGRGGRRVLGRVYDKGIETGWGVRGELVRLEDQRRWPRLLRRSIDEMHPAYSRALWQRRWLPLWQASEGVTVAAPAQLADKLAGLAAMGVVSQAEAERLAGFVLLSSRGVKHSRATMQRRRQRLRELGVILADGVVDDVELDLREIMDAALASCAWGVG